MAYVCKITDTNGTTGPIGSALYGTCSTASATVAKVVTLSDFDKLITGVTIHVKFTNANTASSPTLNVNSTGAKAIYRNGAAVGSGAWQAGQVVSFTYTGSQWETNESGHVVVQSESTTANYRPIMLGYTNTTTIADLAATTINQVYANTSIFAQPSTGNIYANGFIPVEAGGLDDPHSSLGTSTWAFKNAYIANIYTNKIFPGSGVYYNNNSGFASAPWAKTVDFTCTTASVTRWYAFRVYQGYEGTTIGSGLLIVSITTNADKVYSSGKVVWVYAAGGLDKDNFAVTYTNTASTSTTIAIWAKCTKRYQGWNVIPLYGGWGSGKGDIGINCYSTTTGEAAYTGTLITSEYADIKNNAASADKLNTDAGSTKQPVYFTGGVPTAIGYTIAKSVPSDAKFTDENVTSELIASSDTSTSSFYPTLVTGATNGHVSYLAAIRFLHTAGTTSAVGNSRLILGNGAQEGTVNNEEGLIRLYSAGSQHHTIQGTKTNTAYTHTLPPKTGTVINSGCVGTGLTWDSTNNALNHSSSVTTVSTAELKKLTYNASGHITGKANIASTDVDSLLTLCPTDTGIPDDSTYYISQSTAGTDVYNRRSVKYLWQYMFGKVVATYYNNNSGFASAPWAKVASATITAGSAHRHIEFLVGQAFRDSNTTTSYFWGILAIRFNTTSSKVYGSGQVEWLVAHENLDKDNIVVTYTNVASTSTTIEIWAKTTVRYCGYTFRSLAGLGLGIANAIYTDWTFYDPTSGVATYTGTLIASSYSNLKNNAISATTASKLGSETVGGTGLPIYLSSGTATACSVPASGAWWNASHILVPQISTAGVLDIGRYVDFHNAAASTANYTIRLDNASTTSLRFSEVNTTAGANFSPETTAKYDLGTSSLKWRYIYGDLNGGINITAATDGTYYIPFISSTSGYNTLSSNTDISFETSRGDTSSTGGSFLTLGNSTAEGSTGNAYGAIKLYGLESNYIALTAKTVTGSNKEIKLPNYAGTVMVTGIGDALTSSNDIDTDTKDITKHWYSASAAVSDTIAHSPVTSHGYHVFNITTTSTNGTFQKQLLFGNTNIIPYMYRYLSNGTWSGGWRSPGTGFFYVIGTQTTTTKLWTGVLPLPALYDGLTIAYYLPYSVTASQSSEVGDTSSNSNVWINLTLSNGSTTGWIQAYYQSNSRITTHYGAGSCIILTYFKAGSIKVSGNATTVDSWRHCDYNANNLVNVTLNTTSKAYILATTSTPTSTATGRTAVADTGVYLDTTAGSLAATKFTVNNLIEIHDTSYTSRSVRLTYVSTASGTSIQHFPTCDGEIQVSQGQMILYSGTVNLTSSSGTDLTITGDFYLEDFRMLLFEMYPPSGDGAHHIIAPWNYVYSQSPTVIWFQAVPEQTTSHMSTKSNVSVGVSYTANGKIHITPGTAMTGTWGIRIYSLI